jgi:hypothetical protein
MKRFGAFACAAALFGLAAIGPLASPVLAQDDEEGVDLDAVLARMMAGESATQGEELEGLIAKAQKHPLGSEKNPVRVSRPEGQRAYLNHLRCSDGEAPSYRRVGNFGAGIYGNIIDGYQVVCEDSEPAESMVFMDMYHAGHADSEPVPGFTWED